MNDTLIQGDPEITLNIADTRIPVQQMQFA